MLGSQKKKLLVLIPLFVFWVAADLGTKHWADISLADSRHPLVIEVTADQSGQPAGEVVANFLGTTVDTLGDTLPHIALLPPKAALFQRWLRWQGPKISALRGDRELLTHNPDSRRPLVQSCNEPSIAFEVTVIDSSATVRYVHILYESVDQIV